MIFIGHMEYKPNTLKSGNLNQILKPKVEHLFFFILNLNFTIQGNRVFNLNKVAGKPRGDK